MLNEDPVDGESRDSARHSRVEGVSARADRYAGLVVDQRYVVESLLAEGGMGRVYRCRHSILDKKLAIKIIRSDVAQQPDAAQRFLIEAKAASVIGNEHIIDVVDFGALPDGAAYLVMELLEGVPLSSLVDPANPLPAARIAAITLQLAEGLAAAHAADIVHRDLKPDNVVLLERKGEDFVKILDFGVAQMAFAADSKLTQAGSIVGTPCYMSPEQCSGAAVDHRSDIYSLGVMMYELAAGRLPFDGQHYLAVIHQHVNDPPPPFTSLLRPVEVPPELEHIIFKCLAKRPEERYASMVELMRDVAPLAQGQRAALMGVEVPALVEAALFAGGVASGEAALSVGEAASGATALSVGGAALVEAALFAGEAPGDRALSVGEAASGATALSVGEVALGATALSVGEVALGATALSVGEVALGARALSVGGAALGEGALPFTTDFAESPVTTAVLAVTDSPATAQALAPREPAGAPKQPQRLYLAILVLGAVIAAWGLRGLTSAEPSVSATRAAPSVTQPSGMSPPASARAASSPASSGLASSPAPPASSGLASSPAPSGPVVRPILPSELAVESEAADPAATAPPSTAQPVASPSTAQPVAAPPRASAPTEKRAPRAAPPSEPSTNEPQTRGGSSPSSTPRTSPPAVKQRRGEFINPWPER